MLIELRVRDYAVIDDLSLELKPGLNVLSGETGAGTVSYTHLRAHET